MINKKFCALSLAFLLCACGKKSKSQSGGGNSNKEQQKEGEHEPNQQGNKVLNGNDKDGQNTPNGKKEIPKKQDKNFPTGLRNIGCSCYLNSLVQQLYNIEPIRKAVLNGNFGTFEDISNELKKENLSSDLLMLDGKELQKKGLNNHQIKILELLRRKQWRIALKEMFKGMSSDLSFFDPDDLPCRLGYVKHQQEDASEFFLSLLDALGNGSDTEKLVKETFFFNLKESMTKQCPRIHTTDNTFVSGPLACSIVDPFTRNEIDSLNDILEPLFVSEKLSDIRCDICEDARKEGKLDKELEEIAKNCSKYEATKQTQFSSLPRCLVVVLKRFGCNETSCYKINHKVTFPINLDINKEWCAKNLSQNIPSYTLTGVIVHRGSLSGGHYWSYVKKGEKWYKCNDDTVSEVHMDNTLLNSLYGDGKKSDSAYILFYSKA